MPKGAPFPRLARLAPLAALCLLSGCFTHLLVVPPSQVTDLLPGGHPTPSVTPGASASNQPPASSPQPTPYPSATVTPAPAPITLPSPVAGGGSSSVGGGGGSGGTDPTPTPTPTQPGTNIVPIAGNNEYDGVATGAN